jgi:hypothetical protein
MACCSEDRRAEEGACLRLWSWWLWGVLDLSSGGEPKGPLVDCSWFVWSSSCVGCAAPDCRLDVWCLLVREHPIEWIAITGTSLPASKWTSVKNHCVISCHRDSIVIDWLHLVIGSFLDTRYNSLSLSCIYFPSIAKLSSVTSFES